MRTLFCLGLCLHLMGLTPAHGQSASNTGDARPRQSTNATDKAECERQLNKIFEALQEYQRQKQKPPDRLSDLMPEFINDSKILTCPFVRRTQDLKSWRAGILDVVLSDVHTSYTYEFCLSNVPYSQWAGKPKTYRDYKQRQMEKLGPVVPIVRCLAHHPILNLAVGGRIFESGLYWERVYPSIPEEQLQPGPLFMAEIDPHASIARRIPGRSADADVELLDLTANYNQALEDSAIPHRPNYNLAPLKAGIVRVASVSFDARGVLQLGCDELGPPFPENALNIPVRRQCVAVHFLHGAVFATRFGTKIGDFVVHYSDGDTEEVPIIYGKDVEDVSFDPAATNTAATNIAWRSTAGGKGLRLYQLPWKNRRHPMVVESVDFRSAMTAAAPFLVAITVQRE